MDSLIVLLLFFLVKMFELYLGVLEFVLNEFVVNFFLILKLLGYGLYIDDLLLCNR